MQLKEDSIEIKVNLTASSFVSSERKWATVNSMSSAEEIIRETIEHHEETMKEYERFDKERWRKYLKRKVMQKEWGEKRTLSEIEDHFELEKSEKEWFEQEIQIFRKMRLENMDREEAERIVKHDRDPYQKRIGE